MELQLNRVNEIEQSAQKANDAMRQHWNSVVCKQFNVPSYYQSVSVLLIHWADWLNPDLKCDEEVCRYISGYGTAIDTNQPRRLQSLRMSSVINMASQPGELS